MEHYNMLDEVPSRPQAKGWRFRVKIIRVHSWNTSDPVTGPIWCFVIADEAGTKMELILYIDVEGTFKGLENQEGKWVEILGVEPVKAVPGWRATRSPYTLCFMRDTQVRIIDPLNDRHYMEFKSLHEIPLMESKDTKYPIDTMGVVFDTEDHLEDPVRPRMVFYIRDSNDNQIKCVATGDQAVQFRTGFEEMRGRGQVIVVLKMWRAVLKTWLAELRLETKGGLSDFRFNPRLPEVEEFRLSLLNNDAYVRKHGIRGLF